MRRPENNGKHLVYAEEILYKLMQYPDSELSKHVIRKLVDEVIEENEVIIMPHIGWSDAADDDGDIYD